MSELLFVAPMRIEAVIVRAARAVRACSETGMGPRRAQAAARSCARDPGGA